MDDRRFREAVECGQIVLYIEETEKVCDSECICRYGSYAFVFTNRTFCVSEQVHKKFTFFEKNTCIPVFYGIY